MADESKENVTRIRSEQIKKFSSDDVYTELEKAYGKYLYVPYAIPKIEAKNRLDFLHFYFTNAKNIKRNDTWKNWQDLSNENDKKLDAASAEKRVSPSRSITSRIPPGTRDTNFVPEIYEKFPEIFEQVNEYLPFIDIDTFSWTMWSTNREVVAHRDYGNDFGSQLDAPVNIRIKLFDSNPEETLFLSHFSTDEKPKQNIIVPGDTNTFAWNNLRLKHGSSYSDQHKKILMIVSQSNLSRMLVGKNLNRFTDLLDKSIHRYHNYLFVDTKTSVSDYLNLPL
jgi:hypothetical protein